VKNGACPDVAVNGSDPTTSSRVLAAIAERGLRLARLNPITCEAACPLCAGRLLVRDVEWGHGRRRVTFYCPRDHEGTILKALRLRERDLFLREEPAGRAERTRAATRATAALISRLTEALGQPVATPEWLSAGGGKLERAHHRVFRWRCPACVGGDDDPIYRPLVVDSDGRVRCEASDCSAQAIAAGARAVLGARVAA
jgi:hypothetical protein